MVTKEANNKVLKKSPITGREAEYLSLAALGYKNMQIGIILTVGESAVKKTFENVFRKLNAKDRANACVIALLLGILNGEYLTEMDKKAKWALKNKGQQNNFYD